MPNPTKYAFIAASLAAMANAAQAQDVDIEEGTSSELTAAEARMDALYDEMASELTPDESVALSADLALLLEHPNIYMPPIGATDDERFEGFVRASRAHFPASVSDEQVRAAAEALLTTFGTYERRTDSMAICWRTPLGRSGFEEILPPDTPLPNFCVTFQAPQNDTVSDFYQYLFRDTFSSYTLPTYFNIRWQHTWTSVHEFCHGKRFLQDAENIADYVRLNGRPEPGDSAMDRPVTNTRMFVETEADICFAEMMYRATPPAEREQFLDVVRDLQAMRQLGYRGVMESEANEGFFFYPHYTAQALGDWLRQAEQRDHLNAPFIDCRLLTEDQRLQFQEDMFVYGADFVEEAYKDLTLDAIVTESHVIEAFYSLLHQRRFVNKEGDRERVYRLMVDISSNDDFQPYIERTIAAIDRLTAAAAAEDPEFRDQLMNFLRWGEGPIAVNGRYAGLPLRTPDPSFDQ
ncbi:MAG: hypothetical protein AB7G06_01300 [Bdellovibrionales bacterium]